MDLGIAGRKALVLASSRGLGQGIARGLVREGVDVMLTGRDAARLAEVKAELQALGRGRVEAEAGDLVAPGGIEAVCDAAEARLGGVDILVLNGGGPPMGGALEPDEATWRAEFESLVLMPIRAARRLVPAMRARRWGRVLAVTAATVREPIPAMALSNALRAALANWCKTLAGEIAAENVTVNALTPGRILTDRVGVLMEATARRRGITAEAALAEIVATIPAARLGDLEEFTAAALFLVSEAAGYVTGGALRIDGGIMRSVM